jgi:hypothetical protein
MRVGRMVPGIFSVSRDSRPVQPLGGGDGISEVVRLYELMGSREMRSGARCRRSFPNELTHRAQPRRVFAAPLRRARPEEI